MYLNVLDVVWLVLYSTMLDVGWRVLYVKERDEAMRLGRQYGSLQRTATADMVMNFITPDAVTSSLSLRGTKRFEFFLRR